MAILNIRRRWSRGMLVSALLVCAPAAAQDSLENDVKATFLYNFSKFVEWPAAVATGPSFRVCVLADADFARTVDQIISGEAVNGRPLQRVEPGSPEEARRCNILYIGRTQRERAASLLPALRQLPVLTVSDAPRFLEQGGAIQFVLDNNRVRFDVSTRAADRAGLKISSKLLRVARTVATGEAPR